MTTCWITDLANADQNTTISAMKIFILACMFWAVLGYLGTKYMESVIPQNVDGAWRVMVPALGMIYGAVTLIAWKIWRWLFNLIRRRCVPRLIL